MEMRTDYKIGLTISIGALSVYTYYIFSNFGKGRVCTASHILIFMLMGIALCARSLRSELDEFKEENKRLKNRLEISNNE
jgi:hypothetical protein